MKVFLHENFAYTMDEMKKYNPVRFITCIIIIFSIIETITKILIIQFNLTLFSVQNEGFISCRMRFLEWDYSRFFLMR